MSEQGKMRGERPGGLWDWPVGVILAGVFLALITGFVNPIGFVGGGLLIAFGVIALLVRRGAFKPSP